MRKVEDLKPRQTITERLDYLEARYDELHRLAVYLYTREFGHPPIFRDDGTIVPASELLRLVEGGADDA